jgi:hypothetical protein
VNITIVLTLESWNDDLLDPSSDIFNLIRTEIRKNVSRYIFKEYETAARVYMLGYKHDGSCRVVKRNKSCSRVFF